MNSAVMCIMKSPIAGLSRILPACAAAGYLAGILLWFSGSFGAFDPTPILPSAAGIDALLACLQNQVVFFLAVWLCGFLALPFPVCAPILFYRAALAGAAACSLYRSGLPTPLYFCHTAFSALILLLLLSLGIASDRYARSAGTELNRKDFLEYALTFLFLTGTALILLLILQFLLLFVA